MEKREGESEIRGPDGDGGESFDDVVAHYIDRLTEGELLDPDSIHRRYPAIAERLIADLEAFADAGRVERDAREPHNLGTLGDYTLRRPIGRGGMGVVYEAWENSMNRRVALKVLPVGIAADSRACTRFMREAQTAGKLNHPNVVGVYSTGVREGTPWYSMEFVEGETLAQVLARLKEAEPHAETPFGPKDQVDCFAKLARAFAEVADGLQHAHSRGVIHRDIKPSNLILDPGSDQGGSFQARLRILDFGLARLEGQESLTSSGDFVGTPQYMSPEQARARKVPIDHRTDVYSLGATLYEMLTLKPAFRGRDHADTLSQIIERDPVEPRKLSPKVPKDLETIVLKCLRKNAGDRYGTAEALGQDLRRFVRGDPIEARPRSRLEKVSHALARWRLGIAAGACLVLVFGAVVLVAVTSLREKRKADDALYRELLTRGVEILRLEEFLGGAGGQARVYHRAQTASFLRAGLSRLPEQGGPDRLEQALIDFEGALRLYPARSDARYYLSRTLRALGREDEAAIHLALSQAGIPGAASAGPGAWRALQELAARGAWAEVEAVATEVIDAGAAIDDLYVGASLEGRLFRGIARMESQNFEGAIRDFSAASDRWPAAMTPALLLAQAYIFAGKPDDAESWLDECYARTDRKEELAFEAACTFLNPSLLEGERTRALRWLERMPRGIVRERATAYVTVMDADVGSRQQGLEIGGRVLKSHPGDPLTSAILALGCLRVPGEDKRAQEFMAQALATGGHDPYVCLILGDCSFWLSDYRRSEGYYRQAVKAAPDFYWARVYLADSLRRQGRYDECIAVAEDALRRASADPYLLVVLGMAHEKQKNLEEASRWVSRALEIDPHNVHALYISGRIEGRNGKFAEAENRLARARELEPKQPYALGELAVLRLRRQKLDDALESYCAATTLVTIRDDLRFFLRELSDLLRFPLQVQRLDCLDDLAEHLDRAIGDDPDPALLADLALVILRAPGAGDSERPLELARRAVAWSPGEDAEILATLATIEHARGAVDEAVQALERAVRLPSATTLHWNQLETYWHELAPEKHLEALPGEGLFPWTTEEDLLWATGELDRGGAIRVRCGGDGFTDSANRTWGRDRFYGGGRRFLEREVMDPPSGFDGRIAGADDEEVYRNERSFPADGLYSGYRIPLRAGSYRITLHFAEIHYKEPGTRIFGVSVEGTPIFEAYEPGKKGFATADAYTIDPVRVDDGVLNIDFHRQVDDPKISAIEVEGLK